MKKIYNIILGTEKEKEQAYNLINEVKEKGLFLKNEYSYDTIDSYYKYNNKMYIIIFNDNYGYMDSIIESDIKEC